jgi:hypothetical protein
MTKLISDKFIDNKKSRLSHFRQWPYLFFVGAEKPEIRQFNGLSTEFV